MLGKNLKSLRKERGMTQDQLAKKLNVVRQTISKWENELSVPDADALVRIAQVFDTSVNELLEGFSEEQQAPSPVVFTSNIEEQIQRLNDNLFLREKKRKMTVCVTLVIVVVWVVIILLRVLSSIQ